MLAMSRFNAVSLVRRMRWCGVALTASCLSALAQTGAPAVGAAAPGNISKLAMTVVQMGVLRCAERAEQLARFLGRNSGDVLIFNRAGPTSGEDFVSATLLMPAGNGQHASVEVTLVPSASGCSAAYTATLHLPEKCEQAEAKVYQGLTFRPLGAAPYRLAVISDKARVHSLDVAGGCLLFKHEVVK